MSGKPKYRVPLLSEIEKIPWNGFNVVSTFSGGGGSCLGYRMAGYRVLWANEFVKEAQNTYRLNHPGVKLNCKDIREVTAADILRETGLKVGEIDLFDGSPPCCAFSTAGKRENGWGKERSYSDGKKQQIEDLFYEYIRLLRDLQPKVFVAENVSGLVRGKALGFFKEFISEMKDCGYRVEARLLNGAWLGVPQARERLIFVGVRNDIGINPVFPKPLNYYYSIGDALKDVPQDIAEIEYRMNEYSRSSKKYNIISMMQKNPKKPFNASKIMNGSFFNMRRESMFAPCGTILASNGDKGMSGNLHPMFDRKFTSAELKRITSLPDDFVVTGDYTQKWERIGRMVPPVMMMHISKAIEEGVLRKAKV